MKTSFKVIFAVILFSSFVCVTLAATDSTAPTPAYEQNAATIGEIPVTTDILIASNYGQCAGACSEEQCICIGGCQDDGPCMSRCMAAYSRCVARCN